MTSPALAYSGSWRVDARGADLLEPADPWREPAGTLEFSYTGETLALWLAPGDYWGYLFVTIDGEPANRLAHIPGNLDSRGKPGGYTTLYAPEQDHNVQHEPRWTLVHQEREGTGDRPRTVYIEIWRSWGQMPLRAIGVDIGVDIGVSGVPQPTRAAWPPLFLGLGGILLLAGGVYRLHPIRFWRDTGFDRNTIRPIPPAILLVLFLGGLSATAVAVTLEWWWLTWIGLLLLGLAGIVRPACWVAGLLFALPFYYSVNLPLLPGRAFGLVDSGVALGMGLVLLRPLLVTAITRLLPALASTPPHPAHPLQPPDRWARLQSALLWALVGWALVSAAGATHWTTALYEWRTVFLAGGLFWLLLTHARDSGTEDRLPSFAWILGGWLAGATVIAGLAIGQYAGDSMLITAEGVSRVRGLYGSPNNLALYLERSLLVTLGLALYFPGHLGPSKLGRALRGALWTSALLQLAALTLTFSKGALLAGLPMGLIVLWLVGFFLLPGSMRTRRPLWLILAAGAIVAILLLPFLGTERFRNVFDFTQGTGFLRLQLWRSSWAMAQDHWLFGVGPDNFLYAYRSRYLLPEGWQEPNLNHPHNFFLDGLTRLGLPGLLLWMGYIGVGVWRLLRCALLPALGPVEDGIHTRRDRPFGAWSPLFAGGALAATGAALAHGQIDLTYALPDLMLIWVLLFHLLPAAHHSPATSLEGTSSPIVDSAGKKRNILSILTS